MKAILWIHKCLSNVAWCWNTQVSDCTSSTTAYSKKNTLVPGFTPPHSDAFPNLATHDVNFNRFHFGAKKFEVWHSVTYCCGWLCCRPLVCVQPFTLNRPQKVQKWCVSCPFPIYLFIEMKAIFFWKLLKFCKEFSYWIQCEINFILKLKYVSSMSSI